MSSSHARAAPSMSDSLNVDSVTAILLVLICRTRCHAEFSLLFVVILNFHVIDVSNFQSAVRETKGGIPEFYIPCLIRSPLSSRSSTFHTHTPSDSSYPKCQ